MVDDLVYGEDWDRLNDAAKARRLARELADCRHQCDLLRKSWHNAWEWHNRVEALLDEYDAGLSEGRLAERIRSAIAAPVGEGWRQ